MNASRRRHASGAGPIEITTDPIPPELVFERMSEFVVPIEPGFGKDEEYLSSVLVPNFERAFEKLTNAIQDNVAFQKQLEKKLQTPELSSQVIEAYKTTWNISLYRRFVTLHTLYLEQNRSLLMTRMMLVKERIDLLNQLKAITIELLHRPRYFHINIAHACEPPKTVEFLYLPALFLQVKSLRNALHMVSVQMSLVPKPFSSKQENVSLLKRLIDANYALRDPDTDYLAYTEEYELFSQFLVSKASPVRITDIRIVKNSDFVAILDSVCEKLRSYIGYRSIDSCKCDVLQVMCSRFLFDHFMLCEDRAKGSVLLQSYLQRLASKSLAEIGVNKSHIPEKYLSQPPSVFFSENATILRAPEDLLSCHFMTNPIDVLFQIRRIELKLVAVISEHKTETLEEAATFDGLFTLWKILFIAAQIPEIRQVFDFVSKWKTLPFIPNSFLSATKVPKLVLRALLSEALSVNLNVSE